MGVLKNEGQCQVDGELGKGQSRRGNGLKRVILFVLFWDSAALSNSLI